MELVQSLMTQESYARSSPDSQRQELERDLASEQEELHNHSAKGGMRNGSHFFAIYYNLYFLKPFLEILMSSSMCNYHCKAYLFSISPHNPSPYLCQCL